MNLLDANAQQPATPRWHVAEIPWPGSADLDTMAAITRAAFADGDMLPGLPAADGASDTAESIEADLRAGIRLWMAHAGDGRPLGYVRAIPRDSSLWQIRRLAIRQDMQGRGVGRELVLGLERAARSEGVANVVVWALVERGIAPLYARLGYRTTGHLASPGKPLSEAVMEVRAGVPRPALAYPWGTQPKLAAGRPVIAWFAVEGGTAAVLGEAEPGSRATVRALARHAADLGARPARFLGADCWEDGETPDVEGVSARLASSADRGGDRLLLFDRPSLDVEAYTCPRAGEPELLALWRTPVGRRG
ncbi:GNAT family N-acetyltransferase [Nonomuraea fuscirosea]|uniref:GNAT family N-acetyltransferase n=1 Tax=Nonomuraea fuscirosea TaxID=1291556 RepID=UPI0033F5F5B8